MMLLFLTLTQCQKDDVLTQEETSTKIQDVISRKMPFQNSPHFQTINPKISNLNTSLNAVSENQRSIYTDSILILTDEVLYITYANTHTYTFKLLRENPEYYIENIVLHYNTDTQNYDEYLLQYDVSEDEFIDIANGGALSENANTYISKLDNGTFSNNLSRVSCSYSCQTISIPCTGEQHHPFGDTNCPLLGTPGAATQIQACGTSCIVIDDPSFDPSNPPIETGSGGSSVITNPYSLESCTLANGNQGFIGLNGTCSKPRTIYQRIEDCLGISAIQLQNIANSVVEQMDNYLEQNQCSEEAQAFAEAMVRDLALNKLVDFEESIKSPYNVDLELVRPEIVNPDSEKVKFMCIYNKLIDSPTFKNLFVNTFGENTRLHVKFKLDDTLPNNVGGITGGEQPNPGGIVDGIFNLNLLIRMNKNHLNATHIAAESSLEIAKNIIHEAIHAFLYVKKYSCEDGGTIDSLNNQLLGELINEYYDGSCSVNQEQHEFMHDHLIPTMSQILSEIKDDLLSEELQSFAEELQIENETLNIDQPWDWNTCFENLSYSGLHSTQSFINAIGNNPTNNFIYNRYRSLIETYFSKNCD